MTRTLLYLFLLRFCFMFHVSIFNSGFIVYCLIVERSILIKVRQTPKYTKKYFCEQHLKRISFQINLFAQSGYMNTGSGFIVYCVIVERSILIKVRQTPKYTKKYVCEQHLKRISFQINLFAQSGYMNTGSEPVFIQPGFSTRYIFRGFLLSAPRRFSTHFTDFIRYRILNKFKCALMRKYTGAGSYNRLYNNYNICLALPILKKSPINFVGVSRKRK